ncbi:MAG TPA: DUF1302 family protein [Candidatus Binatia bacterium]|nr:DUF1302 family protein [Candidatus Binatia bacterium]
MVDRPARLRLPILLAAVALLLGARPAGAIPLNADGTINLGIRAYVNARIGTTAKQSTRPGDQSPECMAAPNAENCSFGGTFPYSGAGHVIQNRYFLEAKWNHSLVEMFRDVLPESVTDFKYNLTYRGEYDGIYDFGPNEYRHGTETLQEIQEALRQGGLPTSLAGDRNYRVRHRLRQVASNRNRLFLAFVDWEQGPLFIRFGRQNLVWGETDAFRLLDNINPIDASFGGFFIDLDERRVPLDMLRASWNFGTVGPIDQAFLEGYVAFDRNVAFVPGAPPGSPWYPPLGPPTGLLLAKLEAPNLTVHNLRGGGRFVFNVGDYTFTLASYQTVFDLPAVRFRASSPNDPGFVPNISQITADTYGPLVWVNGASTTTALPSLRSVVRGEVAWFKDEALFRGPTEAGFPGKGLTGQLVTDFVAPVLAGTFDTVTRKDTYNMALGWDVNLPIDWINSRDSVFLTTQVFYRHIFDRDPLQALPVPEPNNSQRVVPQPNDSVLQTLAIATTYLATVPATSVNLQITPGYNMFYDWQGSILFQPNVRFVRDPWRFIVDYTTINSGVFRYPIGLVRDRSNVRFQVEYVL